MVVLTTIFLFYVSSHNELSICPRMHIQGFPVSA